MHICSKMVKSNLSDFFSTSSVAKEVSLKNLKSAHRPPPSIVSKEAFMCIPFAAAAAKSLQSCPTLCDPVDGSPPGFPVPGILQARTLEWAAISCSKAWKWKVKVKSLSRVRPSATPWTAAVRLLHPWDFPGKSTGVGCHCLDNTLNCVQCFWNKFYLIRYFMGWIVSSEKMLKS